jgi:hypothetical protein
MADQTTQVPVSGSAQDPAKTVPVIIPAQSIQVSVSIPGQTVQAQVPASSDSVTGAATIDVTTLAAQVAALLGSTPPPPPPVAPVVTTTLLAGATQGTVYSAPLTATGTAPFTFNVSGLPAGLSVTGAAITGDPTVNGSFTAAISVEDATGLLSPVVSLPLHVAAQVVVPPPPPPPSGTLYDGIIQVNAKGLKTNGAGTPIGLRGLGCYGLESQPIGGSWLNTEWGNLSKLTTAPSGPVWPVMQQWGANSVRIALNSQVFLGVNFAPFSAAGSAAAPQWVGTTATAASQGSSIACAATAGFIGTNQQVGPTYLVNLSNPAGVPKGCQILTASGTTITTSAPCTVAQGDVLSMVKAADAPGQIRQALKQAIAYCRQYNLYIIWDLHWSAPQFTFPVAGSSLKMTAYSGALGQPPFMDAGAGALFWADPVQGFPAWLLANYGPKSANFNAKYGATGIGDMIFELFNEPYIDFDNPTQGGTLTKLAGGSCSAEYAMMNGANSNAYLLQYSQPDNEAGIPNQGNYGGIITASWVVYGYQQAVTAIRALGCTNIIMVNAPSYAQALNLVNQVGLPVDPLPVPQIAIGWHPYESGTSGFPDGGNNSMLTAAAAIISGATFGHPVPLIITEYGDNSGTTGGPAAPPVDAYVASIQTFVDTQPVGSLGCFCFQWTSPLGAGQSGTYCEVTAKGTPAQLTITGINGTTMSCTVPAGQSLLPLMSQVSGWPGLEGVWVVKQLSGPAGGSGNYQLSDSMGTAGTIEQNFDVLVPCAGQGQTVYNWMVNHTP